MRKVNIGNDYFKDVKLTISILFLLQLISFIPISIFIIFRIAQGLGYITHDDFLLSMTTRGEKLPGSVIDNMLQVVSVQFVNFEQDSEMCQSHHASGHEVQSGSEVLVPSLLPGRALSYSTHSSYHYFCIHFHLSWILHISYLLSYLSLMMFTEYLSRQLLRQQRYSQSSLLTRSHARRRWE